MVIINDPFNIKLSVKQKVKLQMLVYSSLFNLSLSEEDYLICRKLTDDDNTLWSCQLCVAFSTCMYIALLCSCVLVSNA